MKIKINKYISNWKERGYKNDIPDEVCQRLMDLKKAPSYKAICIAILKNDPSLKSLGLSPASSPWYSAIKYNEIALRNIDTKLNIKQRN